MLFSSLGLKLGLGFWGGTMLVLGTVFSDVSMSVTSLMSLFAMVLMYAINATYMLMCVDEMYDNEIIDLRFRKMQRTCFHTSYFTFFISVLL